MKIYVTGPRGRRDPMVAALAAVKARWPHGTTALPPIEADPFDQVEHADTDDLPDDERAGWLRLNLMRVTRSAAIVLLPGWRESINARRELQVAIWCGLELHEAEVRGCGHLQIFDLDVEKAKAILDRGLPSTIC